MRGTMSMAPALTGKSRDADVLDKAVAVRCAAAATKATQETPGPVLTPDSLSHCRGGDHVTETCPRATAVALIRRRMSVNRQRAVTNRSARWKAITAAFVLEHKHLQPCVCTEHDTLLY